MKIKASHKALFAACVMGTFVCTDGMQSGEKVLFLSKTEPSVSSKTPMEINSAQAGEVAANKTKQDIIDYAAQNFDQEFVEDVKHYLNYPVDMSWTQENIQRAYDNRRRLDAIKVIWKIGGMYLVDNPKVKQENKKPLDRLLVMSAEELDDLATKIVTDLNPQSDRHVNTGSSRL